MLLFIDESGHDESGTPCEVLAGVAIAEDSLWNLVRAIRSAEQEHFGGHLHDLLSGETKGRKLLKTKRFRIAARPLDLSREQQAQLANSLLKKGKEAREKRTPDCGETFPEMVAYSRAVLDFVHHVLDLAASFNVRCSPRLWTPPRRAAPGGRALAQRLCLPVRALFLLSGDVPAARPGVGRLR